MPDSNNVHELQELVINAQVIIKKDVGFACRKYNHGAPPDEVEELTEQINLLLLEDDCRRLKTYDPAKAKFSTWLQQVANHHVSQYFRKQPQPEPIEELPENQLSVAASQEYELLRKEQLALIYNEIEKLSHHNQVIAYLKLREIPSVEIARHLKIKTGSVEREWRVIKTTLVHHLAVEWQSKAKQSKAKV